MWTSRAVKLWTRRTVGALSVMMRTGGASDWRAVEVKWSWRLSTRVVLPVHSVQQWDIVSYLFFLRVPICIRGVGSGSEQVDGYYPESRWGPREAVNWKKEDGFNVRAPTM
jgi:hypothetical protein